MAGSLKVTFTLDEDTVRRIDGTARRLGMPKSRVVREAVAEYATRADRLSDAERRRMLAALHEMIPRLPKRRPARVERELAEVRRARRDTGRATPIDPAT